MPTEGSRARTCGPRLTKHPTQINSPYVSGVVRPPTSRTRTSTSATSMELMAPATVKRRDGKPGGAQTNFGLYLASTNEADHAKSVKVYWPVERQQCGQPHLHRPDLRSRAERPVGSPRTSIRSASVQSADNFTGTFVDINSGDTLTQTQIKLFSAGGAKYYGTRPSWRLQRSGTQACSRSRSPALVRSGITYEWNARTLDQTGRWGPFLPTNASFVLKNPLLRVH